MEDYEVFPSTCNFLEATTINEEQTKHEFEKLNSLCVRNAILGLQKKAVTTSAKAFDFTDDCKINKGTPWRNNIKILERTNTCCTIKSTSQQNSRREKYRT